jgi:hypothetical protein
VVGSTKAIHTIQYMNITSSSNVHAMEHDTSPESEDTAISPSRSGIALQTRPPSFTVHRRVSLSEDAKARNEGLEDTKEFVRLSVKATGVLIYTDSTA